jgi:hypothetical protein
MTRLKIALERIKFSREYSLRMLELIPQSEWFRMPAPSVTHIGWQVGHLAMAEYRLAIERIRGPRPDDDNLISPEFLKLFGKGSVPDPDASRYPSPSDIRGVLDRVHTQAMRELPELPEAEWDAAPVKPHSLAKTKFECLFWCAHHEMLHTGQMGLVRRLLGHAPMW